MAYEVNGQTVECDEEGYITNLSRVDQGARRK